MFHIQMLLERHLTEETAIREMDAKEGEQVTSMDYKSEGSVLVNVSHLEIPAELAVIIQNLAGTYILILC